MMANAHALPEKFVAVPQPEEWFASVDGVFIKQILLEKAGYVCPQHVHKYDHHTMLAQGSIRLWKDGKHAGDYSAPIPILIRAGVEHTLMALEKNTICYCIHRLHGTDAVEILSEAQVGD
jgi:quercetin dioxygenase-like cupin family protein